MNSEPAPTDATMQKAEVLNAIQQALRNELNA
jgi:hypothetical protein